MSAKRSSKKTLKGPPPRASGIARLAADADATEDEITQLIEKTRAEGRDIRSPLPWLRTCHENGDLQAMLVTLRAERGAAELQEWGNWREQQPKCPHGEAGGRELHPQSGEPICAICRHDARSIHIGHKEEVKA
ncbi:hypothetical protein [Saccharopolyspora phatthalungensis]|uniref:Uncharacterized protein n=1 Tax=Saccharopolyspora phatthalungensis TaxID=664693 RepID=A0A840QES1_9PSEU|nr:hypothetical protein [Saccharopolyspora phatthalungensis]MBB5156985.1 hypothetical protein [Saccharopolyspora phatthalungensis]